MIGHFALPFVLTLPKPMKRSRTWLTILCVWMLVHHYVDLYWLIVPNFHHHGIHLSWMDVVAMMAGGLVFVGSLILFLTKANLIPKNDPKMNDCLTFKNI